MTKETTKKDTKKNAASGTKKGSSRTFKIKGDPAYFEYFDNLAVEEVMKRDDWEELNANQRLILIARRRRELMTESPPGDNYDMAQDIDFFIYCIVHGL